MKVQAIWNGHVLAESDATVMVEGNHYFPVDSLHRDCFSDSATTSVCAWKGRASYYNVSVDGQTNADAAWYYPDPKPDALLVKNLVAFWRGVKVEQVAG